MYLQILVSLILAVLAYILGKSRDNNKQIFNKKLDIYSEIVTEINSHSYIINNNKTERNNALIKLFAPARLIGGKNVINEIRNYFSLRAEYFDSANSTSKESLRGKISYSAMELEQLMRKDLGSSRVLSKMELFFHSKR
jgi:hypothetical protein